MIAVVGSINEDLTANVVRRPQPGETVLASGLGTAPGGKGLNQAIAAAKEYPVAMIAALGDDAGGERLRKAMANNNVDAREVATAEGPTGTALISITPEGENSIIVFPGANQNLQAGHVTAALDRIAPSLVLTQLEIATEAVKAAYDWCASRDVRFILNYSPGNEEARGFIAMADPLIVNKQEAQYLAGVDSYDPQKLATLLTRLARSVVITDGGNGCYVATTLKTEHIPATATTVVDTTGAGDAFTGVLAGRLAKGSDLAEAARAAGRESARVISLPRNRR